MTYNNPCGERLADFQRRLARRHIPAVLLFGEMNIRSLVGVTCDNACLVVRTAGEPVFLTDFRYIPALHRTAPGLTVRKIWSPCNEVRELARLLKGIARDRVGFESSIPASRYLNLAKALPHAKLVDVEEEIHALRAVKTVDEITRIASAEALNDEIWARAQQDIHFGMTEKDIQRVIQAWMIALGDGEAFTTIVCAGENAAECHHVPDETVWRKGEPLLVDMGVKLDGVCSDMTRNIKPHGNSWPHAAEYARVYRHVLAANEAAIAAARPGMTCGELDRVARSYLKKAGLDKAFGHSLGHGVGYEIHEAPTARPKDETVLEPGMLVTIEPGVYLEGKLGVRVEDLVLITTTGCEVLSHSVK